MTLAEITKACCEGVKKAVNMLHSMDNAQAILSTCRDIDQLESDADRVMRGAMSKLFRDEPDVRQIIKLKAVHELLKPSPIAARMSPISSKASSSKTPERRRSWNR